MRQHADPVARGHPQALQSPRQARDALDKLAVGVATLTVEGGEMLRVLLQGAVQALGHVHGVSSPRGLCLPRTARAGHA
ncbi:hypothetical protein D3C79_1004070 [compost metagenome]